jgi:hypothetical protein
VTPATDTHPSSAAPQGRRWGARARDWAELCAGLSRPAWEAAADATGLGADIRVLDLGCGSGEFCPAGVARGATAMQSSRRLQLRGEHPCSSDHKTGAVSPATCRVGDRRWSL